MPSVQVCCPPGVGAGDVILIQAPNGHEIEVEVPDKVLEGEIFDVDYRATASDFAYSDIDEDRDDGSECFTEDEARKREQEMGWNSRFTTAQGWVPGAVATHFGVSPGSAKYLAATASEGCGEQVWARLEADQSKRAAVLERKMAQAHEDVGALMRDKPQISKATQEMAAKLSKEDRHQRLLQPCRRTVTPPTEEPIPPPKTCSRPLRPDEHAELIGRLEKDRRDRELRQEQYAQAAANMHRFKPKLPERSTSITTQLGSLCSGAGASVSSRTVLIPRAASATDPDTEDVLDVEHIIQKLRSRLKARAFAKGSHDIRRLFEEYDRNGDGGLSLIEFGRAVRTDGNVDRCKLSKKELDEIFHHIDENGDGRVSFKEFEDFLLLPRWHPSGGSLSRRARAAARRSKVSLDRQLEALNAHIDGLQEQKQNALLAEDYELAARLRDEIDRMRVSVLDVEPKSGNTLNVLVGNGRMPSDPLQRHSQETSTGANQWPVAYAANTTQQLLLDDGPDPPKNMPVPAALTIVHCAKWVAQHGAEFEETLKRKHLGATGWGFLYEGKTRRAQFYRDRLEYEIKLLKRARHREKKKERLRRRRNDPNKFPISDSGADNGYIVVTCPKDVLPGQSFFVQIPSGEQIRVEVPVGITFGDRFQVETRGGSDCAHDTGPGQITDSLKPDISADFTLRPQQNSKRRSVSPRQESGDNKNLDVSDRAQRSFPAGYYQVLRKSVLRADFERPSEVIHILRAGERVYVTKGAKDKDGLVWAMTRNGWVVPRRDGRRVLQLMELRQVKEKRSKQSKFKKDPRKQTLGTATEGASSLQEAAPVPAEAALVPASEAKTRGEDFPNGQAAGAAKKQPVSLRTQQAPAALDTIVGVPGTSGRGLTRRYSIALTPGTIDSFVQQVDISVKHGTGNDHEEETLEIMCPEGVCPGDTLFVTCPDGDEVEIVVPDGVSPGDAFDVSLQRETQDEGGARSASIPFLKDSVEDEDKAIWANTLQDEFMDEECTELGSASTALKSIEDALDPSCHNMTTIDLSLSRAEKVKLKHPAVTALRQKRAQLLEDEHRNPNVPAVPRSELISLDSGATEMSHSEAATRLDFRQRELLSNMQQADKVMREKELQIRQQQESIEAKKQEIMAIERATEAHTKVQSGDQHKPPREAVRTPTARPHAKPGAELEKKKFMLMVVPSALVKFSQKVVAEVGTLPQLEIELIDALKLAPGSSISICTGANFEPAQILGDIPSKGKIKVKEKIGLNSTSTIDEGDEEEEFSEEEDQVQIQPLQRQTDAVAGQTLRRGPSRRYSVSLEQGSLDSFVQQIDVPAAPPDNGASNDQDDDDLETLEIVCPDGVGPGDTLYVTCPDGDEVEILVPDGVSAGDVFDVSLRRNSNDAGGQDGHDEQMDAFEMLQSTLGALEDHSGSRLKDDEQKDDESDTQEDQVQIQPLQRQTDAVAGQTLRRGPSRRYSVSLEQGSLDSFVQQIDVPAAPPDNGASNDQDDDDLETLEIVCPDGVGPGDTLYVTCPDGDEVEILVPDGVSAGDVFDVSLQSLAA